MGAENASCGDLSHTMKANSCAGGKRRTHRCCAHLLLRWGLSGHLTCCIMEQQVQPICRASVLGGLWTACNAAAV